MDIFIAPGFKILKKCSLIFRNLGELCKCACWDERMWEFGRQSEER